MDQGNNSQIKKADNLAQVRKYAFEALRYWYLFVLALIISLVWAWYKNEYTHRVFPVGMSLIVRSQSNADNSAAMLYNNALINAVPNHYDQAHLIKSDPLLTKVVEKLGLHIAYYKEGNIKTTEIYPGLPLQFIADKTGEQLPFGKSFIVQLIDETHFYFREQRQDDDYELDATDQHTFGEVLEYGNKHFRIKKAENFYVNDFTSQPLIVRVNHPASVASAYSGRVAVRWQEMGSGVLNLSINGPTPQKEVDFLNALGETFIEENALKKSQNASKTIAFINDQLNLISDSLFRVENRLEQFKKTNYQATLVDKTVGIFDRLQTFEGSRAAQGFQLRYYDYLIDYIKNGKEGSDVIVPASIGLDDPLLSSLIEKFVELQLNREEMTRNTNNENPYLVGLKGQLADLKKNIIENVENQKQNVLLDQKNLSGEINKLEKEIRALPAAEREYVNIQRMYNLSEDLYVFLMQKRAEAGITEASTTSDITVVNPAKLLGGAISPDTKKNYILALLFGLFPPIAFIFLKNYLNNKVQDKEQIANYTNMPLLGNVGHKGNGDNLVVVNRPKSAVSEAFRSIRSNLQFFGGSRDKDSKVYVVTSSISGEGKTFCSINLATVFAYSGKKTLILGADLRKPKIYQDFELSNETGLSNYLAKTAGLEEIIQQTKVDNLDMISGGVIPPNPSELLMSRRMKELMAELEQRYDTIIIDTPPIGLVTDALVLMPYADHSVFVVRQNYTPVNLIKNAQELYLAGKITNISILLNDLKTRRSDYGYGYGYGYGYYDEREERRGIISRLFNKD